MEQEWGTDGVDQDIPVEILSAVESWLVDPRTERVHRPRPRPTEIRFDRDFSSFLSQHGLA